MTFGVTTTGFNRKLLSDILLSIQTKHRSTFGAGIDVAIAAELGQVDGNFASELAEAWEILEEAYHGFDPETASDYLLTVLASLTGTQRRGAVATKLTIGSQFFLHLNAGVTVNAGSLISVSGRPDLVFSIDANVTNSGGLPADISASATCTQTGPITVVAGTPWVVVTPVAGWTNTFNDADAVTGRDADTDIQLRQRRADELSLRGGSTVSAIKADLLDFANHPELTGINSIQVLENTGGTVDVNGLPGHSFEVVVDDFAQDGVTHQVASANSIAQSIWDSKPAGIATSGATFALAVDGTGTIQIVRFSYVTPRPVFISMTVTRGAQYAGDTAVKAALVARGALLLGGQSVITLAFESIPLGLGATDVTGYLHGFGAPTTAANLAVGVRERATFSSVNIALT